MDCCKCKKVMTATKFHLVTNSMNSTLIIVVCFKNDLEVSYTPSSERKSFFFKNCKLGMASYNQSKQ